jgi:acyl carrier protein
MRDFLREEIQIFLIAYLTEALELGPDEVRAAAVFSDLGLDSATIIEMAACLSERFGVKVDPTLMFDYPTVSDVARELCEMLSSPAETSFAIQHAGIPT